MCSEGITIINSFQTCMLLYSFDYNQEAKPIDGVQWTLIRLLIKLRPVHNQWLSQKSSHMIQMMTDILGVRQSTPTKR